MSWTWTYLIDVKTFGKNHTAFSNDALLLQSFYLKRIQLKIEQPHTFRSFCREEAVFEKRCATTSKLASSTKVARQNKKQHKTLRSRLSMMNLMTHSSEASGCYKQTNGVILFCSFLNDIETSFRKGTSTIHALAEIGQRSTSNLRSSNDATLNTVANERMPIQYRKCSENTDRGAKKNEGLTKPEKHAPMTCFSKQKNKSRKK